MKSFKKIIILNIIFALTVSVLIGWVLNKNYTTRIHQRLDATKEIIDLKIGTFITQADSISESLTTILSNTNNEDFINKFLEDNHTRYTWIDHIYIIDNQDNIVYDSKGKGYTDIEEYQTYKHRFPVSSKDELRTKKKSLKNSDILLLTTQLKVKNKDYTSAVEINMNAFQDEIKLISNRFNINIQSINGTEIYQIGPEFKNSKSTNYVYKDLPLLINISGQYFFISRIVIPSLLIFLVIFLLLTIVALVYKSRLERIEHERLIEQANNEKLRLIGTLAANTAHEIKNPLTSINGFIELTRMKYDKNKLDTHFNIITEELERINDIVTQFLYLGKPTNLEYKNINIVQTIQDVEAFLEYELEQNNINVILNLPDKPVYSYLSEDQLKQILINLFQNSKDALLQTTNANITINLNIDSNNNITLEFKDNGTGITKETIQNIFEPFFTTKSSGSGLGLYLSKKLIEDWNGKIYVHSEEGEGTTFTISLPVSKN